MLNVHVSYGNEESGNWEAMKVIALVPYKELYPDQDFNSNDSFGLLREPLELPNGEVILLGVVFWSVNNSISFVIEKDEETLLNIGVFKQTLEAFDPSVVFKTPNGLDLSFMFSSESA